MRNHKPTLLLLLETKMADHKNIMDTLNFDSFIQSLVESLSGGIVIIWKEDLMKLIASLSLFNVFTPGLR